MWLTDTIFPTVSYAKNALCMDNPMAIIQLQLNKIFVDRQDEEKMLDKISKWHGMVVVAYTFKAIRKFGKYKNSWSI